MARKPSVEGLINSYTAKQLAQRIIDQVENMNQLTKQLEENTKTEIVELKKEIKELKRINKIQEDFINSIGETLKQYKHLIKKDGE